MPTDPIFYVITGIVAVLIALIFFFVGSAFRKAKAEKTIGSAETDAKRILSDAIQNAEARKKIRQDNQKQGLVIDYSFQTVNNPRLFKRLHDTLS